MGKEKKTVFNGDEAVVYKMIVVIGWLLVGYWLVTGWLLVGYWLVTGYLLVGY